MGQIARIYDKFAQWSDSDGNPESVLSCDEMLDDIMFYWLTNSATHAELLMRNPPWRVAFHSVPELPEALVPGKEGTYLDWFFHQSHL